MIAYTAVYEYTIKPPLTIIWKYEDFEGKKVFEETFTNKELMNVKLKAFNNLVDSGVMYNYLGKAQKIK